MFQEVFMRKLTVYEHITLDGIIQAPGGPDEDPSGGFEYGGWTAGYADEILSSALKPQMDTPFDLLLGRKTYNIWASYWPYHADIWPGVNPATKYIASNTLTIGEWQPSVILNGDVAGKVAEIKQKQGPDLVVWGSGDLVQTLLQHDLVDACWLLIYPITLGTGKRLFSNGTIPKAFTVTESSVTTRGVIVVNYARLGDITINS
jgi:dihydrofolate reductase